VNHESNEQLLKRYQRALKRIQWLEQEVMRLKMILEGVDVMKNSLPTKK